MCRADDTIRGRRIRSVCGFVCFQLVTPWFLWPEQAVDAGYPSEVTWDRCHFVLFGNATSASERAKKLGANRAEKGEQQRDENREPGQLSPRANGRSVFRNDLGQRNQGVAS